MRYHDFSQLRCPKISDEIVVIYRRNRLCRALSRRSVNTSFVPFRTTNGALTLRATLGGNMNRSRWFSGSAKLGAIVLTAGALVVATSTSSFATIAVNTTFELD